MGIGELAYRRVLSEFFFKKTVSFTQAAISRELGVSLSTVNNAVRQAEQIGCVEIRPRGFTLVDAQKLLAYFSTLHRLEKSVVYKTRVEAPVGKIEGMMLSKTVFTAYSGYKLLFNDAPADYSTVFVYAGEKEAQKMRELFEHKQGPVNLVVLAADGKLLEESQNNIAPLAQIYADLWNLRDWQAREYLNAIEKRLGW
ncbi:winged helix-turn-helix domain-containing protein [Candidatus Micrarchaeota archaeon]|nr:winged helix-turn-helix domain-containing protein [Candidatus Micrarchaeota archaeon]